MSLSAAEADQGPIRRAPPRWSGKNALVFASRFALVALQPPARRIVPRRAVPRAPWLPWFARRAAPLLPGVKTSRPIPEAHGSDAIAPAPLAPFEVRQHAGMRTRQGGAIVGASRRP